MAELETEAAGETVSIFAFCAAENSPMESVDDQIPEPSVGAVEDGGETEPALVPIRFN